MIHLSTPNGGRDTAAPLNLEKRLKLIQRCYDLRRVKIVDCGCGSGGYLVALTNIGADSWGIEVDAEKIAQFRQTYPDFSNRVIHGNLQDIGFSDASFDAALINEVLEHVSEEKKALEEIHRILKPNGSLILFAPNRLYPFETHGVYLRVANYRIPHYIPFIPYIPIRLGNLLFRYWARNYWPNELRRIVARAGFKIIHSDYVWQTFENISGVQPGLVTAWRPILRIVFNYLETIPLTRTLGVTQFILAKKS